MIMPMVESESERMRPPLPFASAFIGVISPLSARDLAQAPRQSFEIEAHWRGALRGNPVEIKLCVRFLAEFQEKRLCHRLQASPGDNIEHAAAIADDRHVMAGRRLVAVAAHVPRFAVVELIF